MISKTFHFMENKKEEADFLLPFLQCVKNLLARQRPRLPCVKGAVSEAD